jgi:hypothetical protein
MKRLVRFPKLALLVGVLFTLVISGVVFATTIGIDGVVTDWPGDDSGSHTLGSDSCTIGANGCALVVSDPDEAYAVGPPVTGTQNKYDVEQVWFTNDDTNAYLRVDFWENVSLISPPIGSNTLKFCIDEDNDIGTGAAISGCGDVGAECVVEFTNNSSVTVYDIEGAGSSSGSFSVSGRFIELSFPVNACNFTNATYALEVYFDNGDEDADDNIPNSGTVPLEVGSGSPTAVTLSAIDAGPALAGWPAFALVVAMVAGGAGLFVWKRRA